MSDYDDATEVTEPTDAEDVEDIVSEGASDEGASDEGASDEDGKDEDENEDETLRDGADTIADELVSDDEDKDEDEDEDEVADDDKSEYMGAPVSLARPLTNTSYVGCTVAQSEEVIIITGDARRTSDIASVYEFTEAISLRTEQIAAGGLDVCMLRCEEIPESATNARDIAIAEIQMRKCPLKVMRQVGALPDATGKIKKYMEVWSMNELMFPLFQ